MGSRAYALAVVLLLAFAVSNAQDPSLPDSLPRRRPAADRTLAIGGLIRALSDRDETVREKAAESLSRLDPPAVEAVDALIQALGDQAPGVRHRAAEALLAIGTPKARKAAVRYRKRLRRGNGW